MTTEKNKIAQLCDANKDMLSNTYKLSVFHAFFGSKQNKHPGNRWRQVLVLRTKSLSVTNQMKA